MSEPTTPLPENCGKRFSNMGQINPPLVCALPKGHADDRHVAMHAGIAHRWAENRCDAEPVSQPLASEGPNPLFEKIEAAIKHASELGVEGVYDFIEGRGMKLERERIRDELSQLRADLAAARTEIDRLRTELKEAHDLYEANHG